MKRFILLLLCALMLALPAQAEFAGHPLLLDRDAGPCRSLTGSVQAAAVFVDVPGAPWTEADMTAALALLDANAAVLQREAAAAGVQLKITFERLHASADALPDMNDSRLWAIETMEDSDGSPMCDGDGSYCAYCTEGRPILFLLNTGGRCFSLGSDDPYWEEYCVLYMPGTSGSTVRHELLHLYGAMDYYQHSACKQAARALFPQSIMLATDDDATVDSLTAYIIGWTDDLAPDAADFLRRTESITDEDIDAARDADTITGLSTVTDDDATYSGQLVDGIRHGYGTMQWDDGRVYAGVFEHGELHGSGTYRWPSGDVYAGVFEQGERTGLGTYRWASGDVYSGAFRQNASHGYGTYQWASGGVYTGEYVNDVRHGTGTCLYGDGSVYSGEWLNDMRHGQGYMRWSTGETYMGGFEEDQCSGYGVMIYADGTTLAGQWANNAFVE